jgi:hypothetical protein
MPRNLDSSLSAALASGAIVPAVLVDLTLKSGIAHVWSGVGDLPWNGNTYKGVGALGSISPVTEGSEVRADGITLKLAGIPMDAAQVSVPATPPVALAPGQSVAWALPTEATANSQTPSSNGSSGANVDGTGTVIMTSSCGLCNWFWGAYWMGFQLPSMPAGAVIDAIYPVMIATRTGSGAFATAFAGRDLDITQFGVGGTSLGFPSTADFSGQYFAPSVGDTIEDIGDLTVGARLTQSAPSTFHDEIDISFVGLAVYYSATPGGSSSVVDIAGDVQIGAPAKVYFGLMSGGAFIGSPYLAFSGQVDQPTIEAGSDTVSISLALENRLSNLARPSGRRYTAADQRLFYPDDSGFDWVETLNDRADRWGG